MPARRVLLPAALAAALVTMIVSAGADESFAGQTVRILVGSSAGGGYDREARLLARYLPAHLPGSPRVVVEAVPGAGGLIAANRLAQSVAPDGLTIGYFPFAVLAAQLTGSTAIRYDVRRLELLGSPYPDRTVCVFPVSTGITSVERWRAAGRPLTLGSTGRDSIMHVFPALLADTLGLELRIIDGYKGATEVRLGIASGELDGACLGWGGVKAGWPDRRGLAVVLQAGTKPVAELPDVPLAPAFAPDPSARVLVGDAAEAMSLGARFFAAPPGVTTSRAAALRAGVLAAMSDAGYVREARAAGISHDPVSGEMLRARIDALFNLPSDVVARIRRALSR